MGLGDFIQMLQTSNYILRKQTKPKPTSSNNTPLKKCMHIHEIYYIHMCISKHTNKKPYPFQVQLQFYNNK